jgi:hypothetical protein
LRGEEEQAVVRREREQLADFRRRRNGRGTAACGNQQGARRSLGGIGVASPEVGEETAQIFFLLGKKKLVREEITWAPQGHGRALHPEDQNAVPPGERQRFPSKYHDIRTWLLLVHHLNMILARVAVDLKKIKK